MILQYLDLSTGHLTQATMRKLEDIRWPIDPPPDLGWPAMTIASYEHGAFVTVPDMPNVDFLDMPHDLANVLWAAHRAGATLVRFDADGSVDPTLPYKEW